MPYFIFQVLLTRTFSEYDHKRLWNLLNLVAPYLFTPITIEKFQGRHQLLTGVVDPNFDLIINNLCSVFMMRRDKNSLSKDHCTVKTIDLFIPMTEKQVELYNSYWEDCVKLQFILQHQKSSSKSPECEIELNNLFTLKLISDHAELIFADVDTLSEEYNANTVRITEKIKKHSSSDINSLIGGSGKMAVLDLMLKLLLDEDGSVIIISHLIPMLNLLEDFCLLKEYSVLRFDEGSNSHQRKLDARDSREIFIYLASPGTVYDINLNGVDRVVFFDELTHDVSRSIIDYLHMILPARLLTIINFCSANTVEEILKKKKLIKMPMFSGDKESLATPAVGSIAEVRSAFVRILTKMSIQGADIFAASGNKVWIDYTLEDINQEIEMRLTNSTAEGEILDDVSEEVIISDSNVVIRLDVPELLAYQASKIMDTNYGDDQNDQKSQVSGECNEHVWRNNDFCCICGYRNVRDEHKKEEEMGSTQRSDGVDDETLMMCAMCPKAFHAQCYQNANIPENLSLFENNVLVVCPQHKCVCQKVAGVVLFPCYDCLTIFCDSCLDDDSCDNVGRWTPLGETFGYYHRNRHFVRCEPCSKVKWHVGKGEHSDGLPDILPTQKIRIHSVGRELVKKSSKRKISALLTESVLDDGDDNSVLVSIYLNSIRVFSSRRLAISSNSGTTFLDVMKKLSKNSSVYLDDHEYTRSIFLYSDSSYDSATRIQCELNDEIMGAVSLGYKRIVFEIQSSLYKERATRRSVLSTR